MTRMRIARLVVRDAGDPNDGMLLGVVFKGARDYFKPGHVYELSVYDPMFHDVFGDDGGLELKDLGESCIARDMTYCVPGEHVTTCCWSSCISHVLACCSGGYLVLTRQEYGDVCKGGFDE